MGYWGRLLFGCICFFASIILPAKFIYAQSPEIVSGINYLISVQNADGSWGGAVSSSEPVPATISVIETLQSLDLSTDSSYSSASSWLQNQNLTTTDQIAGRIQTLLSGGAELFLLIFLTNEMELE